MSHIKALIATGDWRGLRERSSVDVAPEIAEHLVELPEHRRIAVFRALSRDTATPCSWTFPPMCSMRSSMR